MSAKSTRGFKQRLGKFMEEKPSKDCKIHRDHIESVKFLSTKCLETGEYKGGRITCASKQDHGLNWSVVQMSAFFHYILIV